jgi:DNA-binding transcriptional ArsR family regulator
MKSKSDFNSANLESAVQGLQGLAHPVRLSILSLLSKGEMTVGSIVEELNTSQSAVSQHLSKMKSYGILGSRKESNLVFYSIKDPKYKELLQSIIKIFKK